MPAHRKFLVVTAALAALALPSVAQAQPQNSGYGGPPYVAGQSPVVTPAPASAPSATPTVVVATSPAPGFSWSDAGIGAAIAVAGLLLTTGVALLVRSNHFESGRFHLT